MGRISLFAFRAQPGKEQELLEVMRSRAPLLRRLGFVTERPDVLMRSRGGALVPVSEWASEEAIEQAHQSAEVHALWARFEACGVPVRLDALPEAGEGFATFEALPGAA